MPLKSILQQSFVNNNSFKWLILIKISCFVTWYQVFQLDKMLFWDLSNVCMEQINIAICCSFRGKKWVRLYLRSVYHQPSLPPPVQGMFSSRPCKKYVFHFVSFLSFWKNKERNFNKNKKCVLFISLSADRTFSAWHNFQRERERERERESK